MSVDSPDFFYKEQYYIMHESAKENFAGFQSIFLKDYFGKLLPHLNVKTLLDYGCGKGYQYIVDKIHLNWGVNSIYLYDIGVIEYSQKPEKEKRFDAVLCLDVMEHIRERDLDFYIPEIISYAKNLVVFSICCRPAKKTLPNGENAHLTVKPESWWNEKFLSIISEHEFKQKILLLYEVDSNKDFKNLKQFFINFSEEDIKYITDFSKDFMLPTS